MVVFIPESDFYCNRHCGLDAWLLSDYYCQPFNLMNCLVKEKNLVSFPAQIRLVYFAMTLLGF
jgi:hypothetical protein